MRSLHTTTRESLCTTTKTQINQKLGKKSATFQIKTHPHPPAPQHLEGFDRAVLSLQCLVTPEKHFPHAPMCLSLSPWGRMTWAETALRQDSSSVLPPCPSSFPGVGELRAVQDHWWSRKKDVPAAPVTLGFQTVLPVPLEVHEMLTVRTLGTL